MSLALSVKATGKDYRWTRIMPLGLNYRKLPISLSDFPKFCFEYIQLCIVLKLGEMKVIFCFGSGFEHTLSRIWERGIPEVK